MLTQKEEKESVDALKVWSENAINQPMLGFLQREALMTPLKILDEVQKRTEDGISLLAIFEHAVRREGMKALMRLPREFSDSLDSPSRSPLSSFTGPRTLWVKQS